MVQFISCHKYGTAHVKLGVLLGVISLGQEYGTVLGFSVRF